MSNPIIITTNAVPSEENITLSSSSFFKRNPRTKLPSPDDVRAAHRASMPKHENQLDPEAPHIVRYPELGLCVKYSERVKLTEAQSLYLVNKTLEGAFPAPEIYGWRKDGDDMFLYMELIDGERLIDIWSSLSGVEKCKISNDLKLCLPRLEALRQPHGREFIGECCISQHASSSHDVINY